MRVPRRAQAITAAVAVVALGAAGATSARASEQSAPVHPVSHGTSTTTTPIQHLVVIFDENVSFDHYFGTYPYAANPAGEPAFHKKPGTPTINGLYNSVGSNGPTGPLLTNNPNGSNPLRLGRADPLTCDQDHDYTAEQKAADHGAEDAYPANTGGNLTLKQCLSGFTVGGKPEPVP
ncbi:MAG TPA: alkaline phosphatase family protein, partial [Streptosporangiaceae bacterium]